MTAPPTDRPFRRRVLVNTAAVAGANGWAMVVALVSLPLLLRGLGAAAFGTWVLLQTFSAVTGWFSLLDLGLATAATREVAARHAGDDRGALGDAIGSALTALAALGLTGALVLALAGPAVVPELFRTPERLRDPLRVAVVAFGVQVALDLVSGALQAVLDGYQRVDLSRLVDVVRRTAVAVATSTAALVSHRLDVVAIASASATAAGTFLAAAIVLRTTRGTRLRASTATIRSLFRYGRTVAVLRPLGVLHRTIDRFVVGLALGPAAVSLVEVATQLQNGADSVLSATSYAVVPSSARLEARGDRATLVELVQTGTRWVLLATWPVAALTAVLAGPAIDLWVGERYHDAAGLVAVAVVALALVAPAQVGSNVLLGTGRASRILWIALAAIVVNVVASVVLVDLVGIVGAFQATVLSAAITLPLLLRATGSAVGVSAGEVVRRAVLPAVPAGLAAAVGAGLLVLAPLPPVPTILGGGVLGATAAGVAAVAFGLLPSEIERLRDRLRLRR